MNASHDSHTSHGHNHTMPKLVCYRPKTVACSSGIWVGDLPFDFSIPLLLTQIIVVFFASTVAHAVLRHLGQPRFISQVVAGIILGPSLLLHETTIGKKLFPIRSWVHLDILSILACMLFIFVIAVKTDTSLIWASGRRGLVIAQVGTLLPFAVTLVTAMSVRSPAELGPQSGTLFLQIIARWSATSNSVLACLLEDLNLLTSKLGRLAMSASLIGDIQYVFFSMVIASIALSTNVQSPEKGATSFAASLAFTGFVMFVMRPLAMWMVRRTPEGGTMKEAHLLSVVLMAIWCGLLGEMLGHNAILGPLMLGLVLPGGAPLGTTLTYRLDRFVSGVFLPIYMVFAGLRADLCVLGSSHSEWGFFAIIFGLCTAVKLASVIGVCYSYCGMPVRDSIVVGVMMSCRGIVELHTISIWHENQIMDNHLYAVTILWILGVGGVGGALLKLLYKPSVRFATDKRHTVRHSPPHAELRIVVCVHHPENAPSLLALISASSAPSDSSGIHCSPIGLYLLHLIPLIGRTAGVLAPYNEKKRRHQSNGTDTVINAFRSLEWTHPYISFSPFVGTSPYVTMHEDVCDLAADKRAALIILPFHKHFSGGILCSSPNIQSMNARVLRYAPCSVSILIDRKRPGDAGADVHAMARSTVVLFLGGADDREALAIAQRMAENPEVQLTVMRVLPPADMWETGADGRGDDDAIEEYMRMVDGRRVVYREAVAKDGAMTVEVLKAICEECTFLMVGRREGMESMATAGLEEWREYPELGVMGDIMAAAEFGAQVSTMVVQQQQMGRVK